jgi:formylglycine-generating enzyme
MIGFSAMRYLVWSVLATSFLCGCGGVANTASEDGVGGSGGSARPPDASAADTGASSGAGGAGGSPATDAGHDAPNNGTDSESGPDSPTDSAADASQDAPPDGFADAGRDAPPDGPADAGRDAPPDGPADAGREAAPDGPFVPANAPSCAGDLRCNGESCCASPLVIGGTFDRWYEADDAGVRTGPPDPATVSSFRLDKYHVTVGRFRNYAAAWIAGWRPAAGSGKHAHLNGGLGIANVATPGSYEPGWMAADESKGAPTDVAADAGTPYTSWTPVAAAHENLPINGVNWFVAYAFCIWDGGFLPTEAEWGYAAAAGSEQRKYPWGSAPPGAKNQYAIYGCYYPDPLLGGGASLSCPLVESFAPVGTAALGAGLWGQVDLVGNVRQWNLDWFAAYYSPCEDCASLQPAYDRAVRGASAMDFDWQLQSFYRSNQRPLDRMNSIGVRCARSP